jgi:hypothetical protein
VLEDGLLASFLVLVDDRHFRLANLFVFGETKLACHHRLSVFVLALTVHLIFNHKLVAGEDHLAHMKVVTRSDERNLLTIHAVLGNQV